ncbi:unnamed protein product [Meloidogyne enterolobii]|uniref:Uncharacterized protein n=1 Tax=Meloidogyne enterolobii TaxID=390850 RepID=A0ACB1A600_MELEN
MTANLFHPLLSFISSLSNSSSSYHPFPPPLFFLDAVENRAKCCLNIVKIKKFLLCLSVQRNIKK